MKRVLCVIGLVLLLTNVMAQTKDAFQGILPVTDPQMMRSLNSEWHIKIVKGRE